MGKVTTVRACQFLWLLLGFTLVVEGRMLPTAEANGFEPCEYAWQLPGTDCWPPIGQSPLRDHLHSEGCSGSPPAVTLTTTTLDLEDPECKPVPGRLPPIRCQDPSPKASIRTAKVFEPCKFTWQLPGSDCWPPIGQSPHCDHLHSEGCAGTPPAVTPKTTELENPDCKPVPGRLPPIRCQDPSPKASTWTAKVFEPCKFTWQLPGTDCWPPIGQSPHCDHLHSEECTGSPPVVVPTTMNLDLEDPDCKPVPGRLPPLRCQDPSPKTSTWTAKAFEPCKFTWQLPGTDCWPPIGQSPHCDHLHSEGCARSPPTKN